MIIFQPLFTGLKKFDLFSRYRDRRVAKIADFNSFRGQGGGSNVKFLIFEYVKVWIIGSQELFTELKKL